MAVVKEDLNRVSNYERRFKFQGITSHPLLGPLKVLQHPSSLECVFMKEQTLQSSELFESEIKRQKARIQMNNRFFISFYDFSTISKKDRMNKNFQLRSFIQFFSSNLKSKNHLYKEQGQTTSPLELVNLLIFVLNAGNFLHQQRRTHGDICPSNILILPNGEFRLLERLTNIEVNFPKNHLIRHKSSQFNLPVSGEGDKYFCPLIFSALKTFKDLPLNFDKQKSEVFSAGLCLLEYGTGKSINGIFNSKNQEVNPEELSNQLMIFSQKFASFGVITDILKNMLELKIHKRSYFSEFVQSVPAIQTALDGWMKRQNSSLNQIKISTIPPHSINSNTSTNILHHPLVTENRSLTNSKKDKMAGLALFAKNGQIDFDGEQKSVYARNSNILSSFTNIINDSGITRQPDRMTCPPMSARLIQPNVLEQSQNLLKQPISLQNIGSLNCLSDQVNSMNDIKSNQDFPVPESKTLNQLSDNISRDSDSYQHDINLDIVLPLNDQNYTNFYQVAFKKPSNAPVNQSFTSANQSYEEKYVTYNSSQRQLISQTHSLKTSVRCGLHPNGIRSQQQSIEPIHRQNNLSQIGQNPLSFNVFKDKLRGKEVAVDQVVHSDARFENRFLTNNTDIKHQSNVNHYCNNNQTSKDSLLKSRYDSSNKTKTQQNILKESLILNNFSGITGASVLTNKKNDQPVIVNESPLTRSSYFQDKIPRNDQNSNFTTYVQTPKANNKPIIDFQNSQINHLKTKESQSLNTHIQSRNTSRETHAVPLVVHQNLINIPIMNPNIIHSKQQPLISNIELNKSCLNSNIELPSNLHVYRYSGREINNSFLHSKIDDTLKRKLNPGSYQTSPAKDNFMAEQRHVEVVNIRKKSPAHTTNRVELSTKLGHNLQYYSTQNQLDKLPQMQGRLNIPNQNKQNFIRLNSNDQLEKAIFNIPQEIQKKIDPSQNKRPVLSINHQQPQTLSRVQNFGKFDYISYNHSSIRKPLVDECERLKKVSNTHTRLEAQVQNTCFATPKVLPQESGVKKQENQTFTRSKSTKPAAEQVYYKNNVLQSNDGFFNS
jgi:hypothetical protein